MGNEEKIKEAKWLVDLFELTNEEINSILDEDKYLYSEFIQFNKNLANNYNCKDKNFCGNELIYTQLITGKVLTDIDCDGLISLYKKMKNFILFPNLQNYTFISKTTK